MYRFHFNLPKNDRNAATTFLPGKNHTNLPVIISCYGRHIDHWPLRVEEKLRDVAADKNNLAFITMQLAARSDDLSEAANASRKNNLSDMVMWAKPKKYFDGNKKGIFAFGAAANAALNLAEEGLTEFTVVTITDENYGSDADGPDKFIGEKLSAVKSPVLFLRGTNDKIIIQSKKLKADEVMIRDYPETKSRSVVFIGGDYYLYNITDQAVSEIIKWLKIIGIV